MRRVKAEGVPTAGHYNRQSARQPRFPDATHGKYLRELTSAENRRVAAGQQRGTVGELDLRQIAEGEPFDRSAAQYLRDLLKFRLSLVECRDTIAFLIEDRAFLGRIVVLRK